MHLAKGLEFRAVVVMGCDDEVIPSQERIETVTDESDLEELYTPNATFWTLTSLSCAPRYATSNSLHHDLGMPAGRAGPAPS